ncbi:MAG: hypothetical protein LBV80_00540 [Deltaproteobacteria bacterium]|jgi:anaerobic ribonucleoside-triphosphate reductase|nr:hypothetical protein [Deltaproteobacteria bacterium]
MTTPLTSGSQNGNYHAMRQQFGQRMIGAGIGFERTRRITGYLVGTLDRFNDAKRAEERERVKHGMEAV